MKKTKHFNISVPELGDVPDITQVSNAISDLEDATAGTLEIMKAEMQGTKITLTSVSRKTKRTGYYEGMSIRFKSPQDIEPNYLKTISVDELGDQTLSVEYKVNRNEYIDIVYEENKFTAYPVVVQKTDSVSNNSSILVGTAKAVKTAYDKASNAEGIANTKEPIIDKKTGFNLDKSDSVASNSSNTLATSAAVKTAYDKGVEAVNKANNAQSTADGKVSKNGDTMTGQLNIKKSQYPQVMFYDDAKQVAGVGYDTGNKAAYLMAGNDDSQKIRLFENGKAWYPAANLETEAKNLVDAINELQRNVSDKIGFVGYLGDINSPEELLALAPGIYKLSNKNIFGLGRSWWTVTKYIAGNGDQVVKVNSSAGGDFFIQGGFNNGRWTAWHRFNACPYEVGDVYITTKNGDPSSIWSGTSWNRIEGKFLLATSGGGAAQQTGGSSSVTLGVNNMPSHNHSASQSSHSHTQPAHTHGGGAKLETSGGGASTGGGETTRYITESAGGENTGSAQPSISIGNTGGGQAFSIMPPYFTVHVWVRIG